MPAPAPTPKTARIEVFRPGTFSPMQGGQLSFTAADLKAMADAYAPDTAPAPVVVGHPSTDAPAFGWADGFDFDATEERLYANLTEIDADFAEAVQAGRYKKVSLSFFPPDHAANPVPGTWYPKHVGFLGGAAPAVSGLKNASFSITFDEAITFTADFGEWGFEQTSRMFQGLREWLIEKFGIEDADKALPSYDIEWLDDTEIQPKDRSFANPVPQPTPQPKKEAIVPNDPKPADTQKEADFAAREARLNEREAKIAHDANVSFASELVADGRLLPASEAKVVAILDALPADASVAFAEGDAKLPPADALRAILKEQPQAVSFGQIDLPRAGSEQAASFSSDGNAVNPDQLETHQKALAYQNQHPGTAYLTAVRAVS